MAENTALTPLHQIKHSSSEILFLREKVEQMEDQIKGNTGKEQYIATRQHGIKLLQEKIKEEEYLLNEAITTYKLTA